MSGTVLCVYTCFGVQSLSPVPVFATPWTAARQALCSSLAPGVGSNSCSLSWWCLPTFLSSTIPFSFCLKSFPASGPFPMSRLSASGGQSIEVLVAILPINIQGWFPLELSGFISLQSKGLSRVFPSITIWKHQFFSAQPSLWSNSHIRAGLLEKS